MSDSSQRYGLQHTKLPCPSLSPRICSNSWPSSWWCHPIISSSVVPFSSCLQSFQASGSFQMSQLFASGGQSIRASALASVLPMNVQGWFPLGLSGLISLQSKGLSRVFSITTVQKTSILQPFLWSKIWCVGKVNYVTEVEIRNKVYDFDVLSVSCIIMVVSLWALELARAEGISVSAATKAG